MSAFDLVAPEFERHRALPAAATDRIREAVLSLLGPGPGTVLDLGAGTGRLGRAFVLAKDRYVGLDQSRAMLDRFRQSAQGPDPMGPRLVQAEGSFLPFRTASFAGVLLAHVLSASPGWKGLIGEARRVLNEDGVLFLAQRVGPPDGLDARLREQLRKVLESMNVEMPEAGRVRADARALLTRMAAGTRHEVAARWEVECAPRDFLERHSTGVRFTALPEGVQRESMRRLLEWAVHNLGPLDEARTEEHRLELDAFRFEPFPRPRRDDTRG